MSDEFYVGYQPEAPAGIARRTKAVAAALVLLMVGLGGAFTASQRGFSDAVFEFGTVREFEGWMDESPVASLLVERPGSDTGHSRFLLVSFGKFGAADQVMGLQGKYVNLKGTLVYRDDRSMIELEGGSLAESVAPQGSVAPQRSVGIGSPDTRLVGEIVDSKCFLGVMKPGNLKPHRACATRCISGGIPPVLLVRDADGNASYYLLVGEGHRAINAEILDRIAEPVEVTGRLEHHEDLSVLVAEPSAIRRME